jgi:glycosyltransferase involved in cell wall biosynthesis
MEGWGITVIEANAARTPVIASNVNGLKDSVIDGETGLLVPTGNVAQFAAAMKLIAANHEFREQLSAAAYSWAKQFKWDISADNFYRVIGQSIGSEAASRAFNDLAVVQEQN